MIEFQKQKFRKNVINREPKKDRLDVLMIYPPWVIMGKRGNLQRMLPPLGVLSIASYLEFNGYDVQVVDIHGEQIGPDEFVKVLKKLKPRNIGITVLSAHFLSAHHIAALCKQEVPDAKIYVGGVHAEAAPEEMLQNPAIDAVGRGDGEEIMLQLVNGVPYENILGLSYRRGKTIVHNGPQVMNLELDRYPYPAYHLINFDNYFPPVSSYKDLPAMNILMTRGCPGKCTFCNSAKTTLRSRSPKKIVELIKMLRYEYGIRQIYFYDDTFTATKRNIQEFCELMIADKVDVKWICYARGDMFTAEMAELMSRAGCHQILVGVESGSPKLMARIGKPIEKEKYVGMVKIAHSYGIEVRGSFMVGHMDETEEDMNETLKFAKDMDVDFFQLNITTPYPGTALFKEAKEGGQLLHENYSSYGQNEVVMKLKYLTPEQISKFERYAMRSFYLNPKAFIRQLRRLTNIHQLIDLFKAASIMVFDFLSPPKANWSKWLNFDPNSVMDPEIKILAPIRLTYEVRQKNIFTAGNQ